MDQKKEFVVKYEHFNENGELCWGYFAHCETELEAQRALAQAKEKSPTHNARIEIEWA